MRSTGITLTFTLALVALISFAPPTVAEAGDGGAGGAFRALLEPYEGARVALVADRLEVARQHGGELRRVLDGIAGELTAERAGVSAEELADVRASLPELEAAAGELAAATDLETARDAFYALTKPLVRWRQAAGEGPEVAYCPMKKRSWLQPGGEIGNPYYGRSMADCGERVGS